MLFLEYARSLGFDLSFQKFSEEIEQLPVEYAIPKGCIILAKSDGQYIGCVALRPLGKEGTTGRIRKRLQCPVAIF